MKRIVLFTLCFSMLMIAGITQAQITLPAPSPEGKVYSKVGLTDVTIKYYRPKMKERKIFGAGGDYLVPFDQLWRTGANQGTTITISDPISIGDGQLAAGEYMIFTKPGASEWSVIFYKDPSIGGDMSAYKDADVAVNVKVTPQKLSETVQVLTFNIADIHPDNTGAAIELAWENTSVKVPFTVSFDDVIMKNIEANTQVRPQNYVTAATYYINTGRDPQQALEWMKLYFAADDSYRNQFWNLHTMAKIQKAVGDLKGAKATAEESMERAKKNEGGDFGYVKMNEDFIANLNK